MSARKLPRLAAAPSWRELGQRAGLVARAQVISPISEALSRRRAEGLRQRRMAAIEEQAWAEHAERQPKPVAVTRRPQMHATSFGGAQVNRLTRDWITAALQSVDVEVWDSGRTLRARARQLVRDNATAAAYVNELANQVIGPKGILLQAKATTGGDKPAKKTNDEIEAGWKEWGFPENCSANRRVGWLDLQRQLVRSLATDGEIILRKLKYFDNDFGFAVQQMDPDLLDDTYNVPAKEGRNEIRMGVEINQWGAAVAYHFWTRHPTDLLSSKRQDRVRVPADEIIHAFVEYRPGQTRGISWFAPVLFDLKMLGGIQEAELVATRMSAAKMGFLVQKGDNVSMAVTSSKEEDSPLEMETAPGIIEELPPGWEFQGFDPTHPSTAFAPFTKAIRRDIFRGLSMAYATGSGDLESVNYSSIRAGILPERDFYRYVYGFLAVHVCRPIYRDWLPMAVLTGQVKVDARLASNYPVEWRGRGWPWVDPANDATAFETLRKNGLTTRTDACAERGVDYEENIDQLAAEQEYADSLGVDVSGTQTGGQSTSQESGDDPRDATAGGKRKDDKPEDDTASAIPLRRRTA